MGADVTLRAICHWEKNLLAKATSSERKPNPYCAVENVTFPRLRGRAIKQRKLHSHI